MRGNVSGEARAPHDGRREVWLSMDGNEWEEKNECTNEAEQAKAVYEKFCAQESSKVALFENFSTKPILFS